MTRPYLASDGETGKEILTWEGFGTAQQELAQSILDSGYRPEIVIGISRGGIIPAGALTHSLGLKLADVINVEFYNDAAKTVPDPVLLSPVLDTDSITGHRLLVVDDVVDPGHTLGLVLKLLRGYGAEVRSAVLYAKPFTVVEPDYIWRRTDKWIVFPWDAAQLDRTS